LGKVQAAVGFFNYVEVFFFFEECYFFGDKKKKLLLRWQVLVVFNLLHCPHLEGGYLGREN